MYFNPNFSQKRFGIQMSIVGNNDFQNPENNVVFEFWIKRNGIIRRLPAINECLDTGPVRIEFQETRSCDYFSDSDLKKFELGVNFNTRPLKHTNKGGSSYIELQKPKSLSKDYTDKPMSSQDRYDVAKDRKMWYYANRKVTKTNEFVPKESIKVTVTKPFMFSMNFAEEFDNAMKLRNKIIALNAKFSAEERLAKLEGKILFPEWKPEQLDNIRTTGNRLGARRSSTVGDGTYSLAMNASSPW